MSFMESTTMTRLSHEVPDCDWWKGQQFTLHHESESDLVFLTGTTSKGEYGDWDRDETPNCPECSENLYIEKPDGEFVDPWDWFSAKQKEQG